MDDGKTAAMTPVRSAVAVFVLALTLRLLHVWQLQASPFADLLLGDAQSYDAWAQRIAAGDWLGGDVFYQAPLYPYLLGVLYIVAGHSVILVRVLQAFLGACSCALLADAGRRLISPRAGLFAGAGLALAASAIFTDGLLQKSTLDLLFVCLMLWLVSRAVAEPRRRAWWLWLGVTLGCLSLTRENGLVLLLPFAAWIIADRAAIVRQKLLRAGCVVVGTAAVLAPVAVRNAVVGHGFFPTTAQLGPNLYIGNHPGATGLYEPLRQGRGTPEFERTDATELAERAEGRPLTPGEVSRYWVRRSVRFATDDPIAWARVTARKALLLVSATEIADTEAQESHAEYSAVLTALGPITHVGVLLPLAALGLSLTRQRWWKIWVVPALAMTYALSVVPFYVLARYRYPLLPFVLLFAADGVAHFVPAWRRTPVTQRAAALAVALVVAVAVNWPVIAAESPLALTENNIGGALQVAGRVDEAVAHYRRAIALDEGYADAYLNLGTALAVIGQLDQAHEAFATATRLRPDVARGHHFLGRVLTEQGREAEGIAELRQAGALAPDSEEIRTELGVALIGAGDLAGAIAEFREAVRVAPALARAHANLGNALLDAGRASEAVEHLRQAVTLDPQDADSRRRIDAIQRSPVN